MLKFGKLLPIVLPAAVIALALVFVPLVFAIALGFLHMETVLSIPQFVGISQYVQVLHESRFWYSLVRGLEYSLACIALQVILGVGSALILRERFWGRGLLRGAVILPYAIPPVVGVMVWKFMLTKQTGVVDGLLRGLGVDVPWFSDPTWAMGTVILISVWLWTPFVTVGALAGLQSIHPELYEIAHVDGAGPMRRFWHVTLPSLAPVLVVVCLLRGIWMFNKFDVIYLATGGGPLHATEHLPILAYRTAFGLFDLGKGAAIATLNFVFILVAVLVYLRLTRRWLAATGPAA